MKTNAWLIFILPVLENLIARLAEAVPSWFYGLSTSGQTRNLGWGASFLVELIC
jgi:hypothetical protein